MKKELRSQIIIAVSGLLLLILVFSTIVLFSENVKIKKQAEMVRLSQDSLMAVKQLLEREIFLLKQNLDSLKLNPEN